MLIPRRAATSSRVSASVRVRRRAASRARSASAWARARSASVGSGPQSTPSSSIAGSLASAQSIRYAQRLQRRRGTIGQSRGYSFGTELLLSDDLMESVGHRILQDRPTRSLANRRSSPPLAVRASTGPSWPLPRWAWPVGRYGPSWCSRPLIWSCCSSPCRQYSATSATSATYAPLLGLAGVVGVKGPLLTLFHWN